MWSFEPHEGLTICRCHLAKTALSQLFYHMLVWIGIEPVTSCSAGVWNNYCKIKNESIFVTEHTRECQITRRTPLCLSLVFICRAANNFPAGAGQIVRSNLFLLGHIPFLAGQTSILMGP